MSNRGKVTKAQAAPAAKHEVCGKGSAQLGLCLAITIFVSTVPCAVAIAVQTSADHSGAPDANLESPAIGRVATCVHRAEFRQPSAEDQWGGGKTAAGSKDATAEWRRGDPRAVQGTNALARPLGGRNDNTLERGAVEASPLEEGGWRLRVVASERRGPYGPPRSEGWLKRRRDADRTGRVGRLCSKGVSKSRIAIWGRVGIITLISMRPTDALCTEPIRSH